MLTIGDVPINENNKHQMADLARALSGNLPTNNDIKTQMAELARALSGNLPTSEGIKAQMAELTRAFSGIPTNKDIKSQMAELANLASALNGNLPTDEDAKTQMAELAHALSDNLPTSEDIKAQWAELTRAVGTVSPSIPEKERTAKSFPEIQRGTDPLTQEAFAAYEKWAAIKSSNDQELKQTHLEDAYEAFILAREEKDPNALARAEKLQIFGNICRWMGKPEEGVSALEEAVAIYRDQKYLRQLEFSDFEKSDAQNDVPGLQSGLQDICLTLVDVIAAIKEQAEDKVELENALIEPRSKLQAYTKEATEYIYSTHSGVPVDPSIDRAEQGEAVLFNKNKHSVGTMGIIDCLGMALENPTYEGEEADSTVIHVDSWSTISTLDPVFEALPPGSMDIKINGAIFEPEHRNPLWAKWAGDNVQDALTYFYESSRPFRLTSATIFDTRQPQDFAIIENFKMKEVIANRRNPDMVLGNHWQYVGTTKDKPFDKAFHIAADLTKSDKRAPRLLNAEQVANLKEWDVENIEDLYPLVRAKMPLLLRLPSHVGGFLKYLNHYKAAVKHTKDQLNEKIGSLRSPPDSDAIEKIIAVIETRSIHIGSEANIANQPLVDFIKAGGFKSEVQQHDGVSVTFS